MVVQTKAAWMPALALAALIVGAGPLAAAEYFAGKTITVQVPSGSGGTYHVYCQLVQRSIGKYIPGNPKTLIQNKPGGGGASSAAYMMNAAPKDGTHIAMIAPGTISTSLVREVKFDAREFNWLGSVAARAAAIWIWHTHGITTLDQLKQTEVTLGSTGFSASGSVVPRLINTVLGTKMKIIYGYKGGGAINVAIESGETMGRWVFRSGLTGVRPTWIPEKKMIPIVATGPRDAELKGVPHLRDLLAPGSVEQKLYDVVGMDFEVGQAFYAPPGLPKQAVDTLRKAFAAMIADPAMKAEIVKRRIEFSPLGADEVAAKIRAGFEAATPEVIEALKEVHAQKKS